MYNIAPRVMVYPAGSTPPPLEAGWIGLAQLPKRPGHAVFGDGSHPTTRLCAAAVDLHCRRRQMQAVLDVGTGTGILARIARARGAEFIVGTDIDLIAVASAQAHAALDGHPVDIQFATEPCDHWGARFDLVVANILEGPLHSLTPALCRALAPGGTLFISGFTRPQVPALSACYQAAGLISIGHFSLADWALLKFVSNQAA